MRELALISAYDKEGLSSIARALQNKGMELLATGKTRVQLEEEGLKVIDISEITGEPERFGGRIKTLHHKIMGGILLRPGQDEAEWPFDFRIAAVVCNFYPFREKAPECETLLEMMDWVDIGGPTMVRAAAKNHKHVWVLTRPDQYTRFIAAPQEASSLRARFALEAFELVQNYNQDISFYFQTRQSWSGGGELHYGENPHQKARFLPNRKAGVKFYGSFSFNNVRDAEAGLKFVTQFDTPTVAVVKHQTLCGAASATHSKASLDRVFELAWEGDEVSRFGGIVALNCDPSFAILELIEKKFIEVIVAPRSRESEVWAEQLRAKKERLKILLIDPMALKAGFLREEEVFSSQLGTLWQEPDEPAEKIVEANFLDSFGQWTAACSKSNAITLVGMEEKSGVAYLAGVGQGQPNRVEALSKLALPRAKNFCERMGLPWKDLVCVSDAFLPFDDSLRVLNEVGLKRILQPGGSKNDEKIATTAKELGLDMKITGRRHFWH